MSAPALPKEPRRGGPGRFPDAYPWEDLEDFQSIKRAERWRDRELADLPDPLTEQEEAELNAYWKAWDAEHQL